MTQPPDDTRSGPDAAGTPTGAAITPAPAQRNERGPERSAERRRAIMTALRPGRPSLGVLLALCLAGLQFFAVLGVVFSSFISSERALIAHAGNLLRDVGTNAIEHSKGFLSPARDAAELAARLAQNRIVASDDPQQLEQLLFQQLQLTPQFAGLYFGDEAGNFVMVMRDPEGPAPFRTKIIRNSPEGRTTELIWRDNEFRPVERQLDPDDPYDPRTRLWYIDARAQGATIWTDPYIFFSSQQPGITLGSPVFDEDGMVRGVVGVDIEISMLSDFLSRLRIGLSGRAMVINRNGDVIAHPDMELIRAQDQDGTLRFASIGEIEDPIARAAFAGLVRDGTLSVERETASRISFHGAGYVATVMPVGSEFMPWTIAVYAPENDFTAAIKENRLFNIWIAAIVAAVTGILGLLLARMIHRPVQAFAIRSALVAQGEIDPATPAPRTYSELEQANAALVDQIIARREAEQEYGQTFELSSRGMAQVSPVNGAIIRANKRFGEIVGAHPEQVVGREITDVGHPDDLVEYNCGGKRGDGILSNYEMRWFRRDGAMIWVRLNTILIHDSQGKLLHGVLTVDDITQEKDREGQIARLSRELAHLARGDTMSQMAAGLAHELNQPLTAIAQNADSALLTLEEERHSDAELAEILQEIERQSLRAGDIIRALRGFIRKDEGAAEGFDLAALLDQTLRLVHAEAVEAGVQIVNEINPRIEVRANRVQVAQVLVNLMRNAIEAIAAERDNERRITLRAIPRAAPSAGSEPRELRVEIEDTGPGVDPSINIFAQFETTKPAGMGLGLSICRALVEANGGRLWHEAAKPRGARFCFTLQLQDNHPHTASAKS